MPAKILVVDDDPDLVYLVQLTLSKAGYDVRTAPNGQMALLALKSFVPDLMIFDLTMPIMSGWQLCMKVRQDARFVKTPIIVLSGLLSEDAEPTETDQASAYLVKPFEVDALLAKVKGLLPPS